MIGVLINVRLSSERLKRKHLILSSDKTFLEWLILRIQARFQTHLEQGLVKIIIATGDEEQNYPLNDLAKKLNVSIYFGSTHNIPLRHLECGHNYGLNGIINVDGDDILCSTNAMLKIHNLLNCKIAPFVKTTGLPFGMNVLGYSMTLLDELSSIINSKDVLDTGWGSIFQSTNKLIYSFDQFENDISDLRMTLDYEEDSTFFLKLIEIYGEEIVRVSDDLLIQTVVEKKLFKINENKKIAYWDNFNKKKE